MAIELSPELTLTAIDALAQAGPPDGGFSAGSIDRVTDVLVDTPEIWIGAAAGGAFGAAIGALPAFIFTGFLVIAGALGGQGATGVGAGFGPVFGPHISFAGGAAAAAYAAKQGYMESGFDYHNGKDIGFALGSKPDILASGAVFGLFGIASEQLLRNMGFPTDPIAITVVISALVHRLVFGYSVLGAVSSKANGRFDMGPFEREEMRDAGTVPGDGDKSGEDRLAVEPWLPNMYKWSHVAAIGIVAGAMAGYITGVGGVFFGFGLSAASLIFLNLGVERIPVTHHMTLPGATAYVAVTTSGDTAIAGLGAVPALVFAALFGMIGALIGEAFQRIFYAHGDTHVDPPAAAISLSVSIIAVLAIVGVLPTSVWVPGTYGGF
ncbi:hypothetical protein [Halovenus amylolytica]|uniref:hypothetical protein n=1 Tax=Halovenus amylolytica TaxID=2500550 RepID=UPI003D6AA779